AVLTAMAILGSIVGPPKPASTGTLAATPVTTTPTSTTTVPPTTTTTAPPGTAVTVGEVLDGDTVRLVPVAGGDQVTAHLLGIDSPEIRDPNRELGCFGPEARTWATGLLLGKRVMMRTDPTQDLRDALGNTLVYLTLPDGTDYSVEAVREGYAKYAV